MPRADSNSGTASGRVSTGRKRTKPTRADALDDEVPLPGPRVIRSKIMGDLPAWNDWSARMVVKEPQGYESLYIIGGCPQHDVLPSSSIFKMELRTLRWTDLTNETRFWSGPFGNLPTLRPIPPLHNPGIAAFYIGDRRFMLSFGGRPRKRTPPSADLVAMDLDTNIWFVVPLQGGPVRPRMSATMVTIGQRLYIFGGLGWDEKARECQEVLDTFSVAECTGDANDRQWRWLVQDRPYPDGVPSLGFQHLHAMPVYSGKKILLTAGRDDDTEPYTLSGKNCILFSPTEYTFQQQSHTPGEFPEAMRWYFVDPFPPPNHSTTRARNRRSSATHLTATPDASDPNFVGPSVLIVGWIPFGDDGLVPEFWKYSLPPDEHCICLNLRQRLWDLDLDLQMFAVVGGRMFFFGRSSHQDLTYNTCVEVVI